METFKPLTMEQWVGLVDKSRSNPCILTGGDFIPTLSQRMIAHGDWHLIGTTLIFNAVTDKGGETLWTELKAGYPLAKRQAILYDRGKYFERRGIICIELPDALFNQSAIDYLLKGE